MWCVGGGGSAMEHPRNHPNEFFCGNMHRDGAICYGYLCQKYMTNHRVSYHLDMLQLVIYFWHK